MNDVIPHSPRMAPAPTPPVQRGVVIKTIDELGRFCKMVADSGLAPKGFDTPQKIAVAVQLGLELGLAPLASLQNIAVINGKPGVYGDAAIALVNASGLCEDFDEWWEQRGEPVEEPPAGLLPDDFAAVCYSKRFGRSKGRTSRFSVTDAKRAGLWGKAGPWVQYPGRMLMFRARGFNLRDQFADVLKGLSTVEELQDHPASPPSNVAPATKQAAIPHQPAPEAPPVTNGHPPAAAKPQTAPTPPPAAPQASSSPPDQPTPPVAGKKVSHKLKLAVLAHFTRLKLSPVDVDGLLAPHKAQTVNDLTMEQAEALIRDLAECQPAGGAAPEDRGDAYEGPDA